MTHHPYGPDELDRVDPELDEVARRLERYADDRGGDAPAGLRARIHAAIDAEPDPSRGWWRRLIAGPASWTPAIRSVAGAGVAAALIIGAVAIGGFIRNVRPDVGASPVPSTVVSPTEVPSPTSTPTPTVSPTPTSSPSPTPSPSPSPTVAPTRTPASAAPTASDDDDDDESETPEPSESDHSGPGGGGDDD